MPRIRAESIEQHKAINRAAILNAAEESFYAHGYATVSLGSVADLAGIPRSTLYDYFPNKQALMAALIEERVPPLLAEWVGGLSETSPWDRLEALFTTTLRIVGAHPRLAAVVLGAGRGIPRTLHDQLIPVVGAVFGEVNRICSWGIAEGEFAEFEIDALTSVIVDVLAGGVEDVIGRDRPARPVDVVVATRLSVLRHGIATPDPAGG
jgi:AcrR family transcriptional regulator